jgi:hypothetical protein
MSHRRSQLAFSGALRALSAESVPVWVRQVIINVVVIIVISVVLKVAPLADPSA